MQRHMNRRRFRLTLRSLAEVAQLPLYTMKFRDSSAASIFQKNLELAVHVVQHWNCCRLTVSEGKLLLTVCAVFLLDEADDVIHRLSNLARDIFVSGTFDVF